jgi:hypothetical protein
VTPQGHFTVIAQIATGRGDALREVLEHMSSVPGISDPANDILPFGTFERLHFARLVVLDDSTLADIEIYGVQPPPVPTYLAFMGDCDGSAHELLADMAARAETGLRRIFGHCTDFDPAADLFSWMLAHDRPPAAYYVNWVGRTVLQIKEESALQRCLSSRVTREPPASGAEARARHRELVDFVAGEVRAGHLSLTPPAPTPFGWLIVHIAYLIAVPVIAIALLPLMVVLAPFFLWQLRRLETSDAEICPRPELAALQALQRLEDVDVTNQYTAIGSLKPGWFRNALVTVLIVLVDYFARQFFTRGYLARVRTIHFARWVFLDGKSRMLFASSYDGAHEAYMDDFINKVAWGLNLVFSNGVGWPRTDWLITRGARREHLFKYFQRRHQIPSQVWYKAYPGLTLIDLERNHRIRQGLQLAHPSDSEAIAWLNLL